MTMRTTVEEENMQVQPYLFFDGRCEEAIEFYKTALGAKVKAMMRFKDMPDPDEHGTIPPNSGDKIMHASLRIGETEVMASDGNCQGRPAFQGFSLSLNLDSEGEAERVFDTLAKGGQVQMQLARTFFALRFGMVTDRFGVPWMVHVPTAH
jgi:PhnB protein